MYKSTSSSSPYALDTLLRQHYNTLSFKNSFLSRRYTTPREKSKFEHPIEDVAVLGGGITGLATAYYLAAKLPHAKITLFEGSSRLGGWLLSKTVNVGNGEVVFEQGPRNLRPDSLNGSVTLDLVSRLGLISQIIPTAKNSMAAQNRFLYYPDHLVRMPGPGNSIMRNLSTVLREPVFKGVFPAMLREPLIGRRSETLMDESIGSFISRRFGVSLADNLVSAICHGIYAGDIYKLSARSILSVAWEVEKRQGSLALAFLQKKLVPHLKEDIELMKQPRSVVLKGSSIYTFVGGLGSLADALVIELMKNHNVKIRKNTWIKKIEGPKRELGMKVEILSSSNQDSIYSIQSDKFSHIISTISGVNLSKIVDIPPLGLTPSVTVMVVNMFFPSPDLLPVHGFGYLIPRSVPFVENVERALGVIFDSDASVGLDSVPGTKVTVMLGGHWWDGWDTYPDESEGVSMAKAILKRHLGIEEEPEAVTVGLQKDCIPQYTVGHDERMDQASQLLENYEGTLRVAGNSYTGVGLNDCVRSARDVVTGLVEGTGKTGLESFVGGRKWVWAEPFKSVDK